MARFEDLKGKTLIEIIGGVGDDELLFITAGGEKFRLFHRQDGCVSVTIEDIAGDLDDLLLRPLLVAEVATSENFLTSDRVKLSEGDIDSYSWTFYKLATIKGSVTIRWFGESNGYYSEEADFDKCSD